MENHDPGTGEIPSARLADALDNIRETVREQAEELAALKASKVRAESSSELGELFAALAKAQGQVETAFKDGENPHYNSRFADLDAVWRACRTALSDNGLSVIQLPRTGYRGDARAVTVRTQVGHASGQWTSCELSAEVRDFMPQTVGSAITYLRRYSLMSMVGVAPGDDDDGEGAQGRRPGKALERPSPQPQKERSKSPERSPKPSDASTLPSGEESAANGKDSSPVSGDGPMTDNQFDTIRRLLAKEGAVTPAAINELCEQYAGKSRPSDGNPWTESDAEKMIVGMGGGK